jgi:hypothetical protein
MKSDGKTLRVKIDAYTRACLTVLAVLLTVVVLGLWANHAPQADSASAAEPRIYGPTKQRENLIKAQKATNDKLDEILRFLKSGKLTVHVAEKDDADVVVTQPSKKTGDDDAKIIIRKSDR